MNIPELPADILPRREKNLLHFLLLLPKSVRTETKGFDWLIVIVA